MKVMGLVEIDIDHWATPDGLREIVDFGSGIIVTTRLSLELPAFDVETIHRGNTRDIEFLNSSIGEHLAEIVRRTNDVRENGIEKFIDNHLKS